MAQFPTHIAKFLIKFYLKSRLAMWNFDLLTSPKISKQRKNQLRLASSVQIKQFYENDLFA